MEKKLFARYPIGNPRRRWRQDNFILSIVNPGPMGLDKRSPRHCELARRSVETAVAAGFDWMELLWASPEVGTEILRTAERLSSRVLYQDLRRFGGMGWSKQQLNENNDLLGAMRDTSAYSSIIGYSLYDEPIKPEQRAMTREMLLEAEAERPDLLPFTVSDSSCIAEVAREIDPAQLSFDHYPFGVGGANLREEDQLDRSKLWYFFALARREAAAIGAPFWFYYQGHELHYNKHIDFCFNAARVMAYGAILYGAKQLADYIEFDGVLDPETGGPGVFFEEQRALNREISMLGNTLMALECRRVLHDAALIPEDVNGWEELATPMEESELLTGQLPRRISVSELRDEYGHDYLMVLNRDYHTARHVPITLRNTSHVFRVSAEDGLERLAEDDVNKFYVYLPAGGFALYRIQPQEKEAYLLEYYLDKAPRFAANGI